jgi:WD40 repeat protein
VCCCFIALHWQVLWLAVDTAPAAAAATRSSSCSIRLCHAVQLPLLRTQWVLDAALLLLPHSAYPDIASTPQQQQQQQHSQLPSLQLFMLLMDNTVQVWHTQPTAAAAAGPEQLQCVLRAACSSRASLYSGALLLQQQQLGVSASFGTADQQNGSSTVSKLDAQPQPQGANDPQQQQQQQISDQHAEPAVWVAAGTAFGEILLWQLPYTWRTAAIASDQAAHTCPVSNLQSSSSSSCNCLAECPVLFRLLGHEGSIHRVVWGPAAAAAAGGTAFDTANLTGSSSGSGGSGSRSSGNALQLLGSCSDDRTCRLWRLPLQQSQTVSAAATTATAAGAGQGMLSTSASSARTQGFEPVVMTPYVTLWGHTARVWHVALLPLHHQQQHERQSGTAAAGLYNWLLVATASEDCSVRLWDGATGRQLAELQVG